MTEILPFVSKNDPEKPNFIKECGKEGIIRTMDPNAEDMTSKEHEKVMNMQERYYREHWHRALLSSLRYQNPAVANADGHSILSIKMNPTEPIYFHVDFLKPGKCTYLIEHQEPINPEDN